MAGGREIKTKIKSVQNTRKVIRALEMVSASKIRKAQDRMKASRPYARLMRQMIGHIAKANSEYVHPFLAERNQIKRVGYIIVSTDRGLCGGLNSGMFRRILADMREWQAKGAEIDVVCIGQKGTAFFRRLKVNMLASVSHLGEPVHVQRAARHAVFRIVRCSSHPEARQSRNRVLMELNRLVEAKGPSQIRRELLWLLSEIAGEESLPILSRLLAQDAVREEACMALERIPGKSSLRILERSLAQAPTDFRPVLAAALARRGREVSGAPSRRLVPKARTQVQQSSEQ